MRTRGVTRRPDNGARALDQSPDPAQALTDSARWYQNSIIEEEGHVAVEEFRSGGDELATLERWPNTFDELQTRVARRFLRPEVRGRVRRHLGALLGRVKRKNGWQMAEQMGEVGPQGAQRLLNAARWDADAVRDDLREYVIEQMGEEESGGYSSWMRLAF
jgi:hypothetical protein